MSATGINHVSVTVTDFDRAKLFYTRMFELLGAKPVLDKKGAPHREEDGRFMLFAGNGFMFAVFEASKDNRGNRFDRYNVGLHHVAFNAPSRKAVDDMHRALVAGGVTILDAPAEYPYVPGYYCMNFADPDGMKFEYVHIPG
jgi:glyoxylase I family protein